MQAFALDPPAPSQQRRADENADHIVVAAACVVAIGLLLVLPYAAFALTMLLLINARRRLPSELRIVLGVVAAISLSMMTGARPLDPAAPNDIDSYYDIYLGLAAGEWERLTTFGGGAEVAMPLLMAAWSFVLPDLSANGLMFCLSLTAALLMMAWVESTFRDWPAQRRAVMLGACLLLLNLYFATQLSRQFLSLIVLLFAISAPRRSSQFGWLVLAASFHLTALPFFGIYLLARRGPWGWLALFTLAIVLRLYFVDLVGALGIVPVAVAEKLLYYADNDQEGTDADIGSLRLIVLLGLVSLLALAASTFRPDRASRRWLAVPWVTAGIHLLLLPIPLASLRVTLMVHSVATGLIVVKMLEGRAQRTLSLALNVLFVYKLIGYAMADKSGNLLSTLSMAATFLQ